MYDKGTVGSMGSEKWNESVEPDGTRTWLIGWDGARHKLQASPCWAASTPASAQVTLRYTTSERSSAAAFACQCVGCQLERQHRSVLWASWEKADAE